MDRKPYPTDVRDEEWAFVAPYLTLMREDAPQREYPLREVFNGLRYVVRGGISWRMIPNDLPPWEIVYQQTQRWLRAGVFEAMVHDLRAVLRLAQGAKSSPVGPYSTVARCNPARKAGSARVTTEPSDAKAAKPTWQSIPSAICWLCM